MGHKAANCKESGNQRSRENSGRCFPGKCHYCGIWGHKKADCRKKKADDASGGNSEYANVVKDEKIALLCKVVEAVQKRNSGCIMDFLEQNPVVCRLDSKDEMALTTGCADPESVNFSESNESSFGYLASDI